VKLPLADHLPAQNPVVFGISLEHYNIKTIYDFQI